MLTVASVDSTPQALPSLTAHSLSPTVTASPVRSAHVSALRCSILYLYTVFLLHLFYVSIHKIPNIALQLPAALSTVAHGPGLRQEPWAGWHSQAA